MANIDKLNVVSKDITAKARRVYFAKATGLPRNDVRKVYFNNVLIWQSGYPFVFLREDQLEEYLTNNPSEDTMIFVNFTDDMFVGTYNKTKDAEIDKPEEIGEMVVETTEGDD